MSDRYVLVRVTNPTVDQLFVEQTTGPYETVVAADHIPISEDDQLREDIDLVTRAVGECGDGGIGADKLDLAAARRLRAAAGLDQEDG